MNTTEILKNIANKEGAGYFTVFLPSLGKQVRIKHLTINDQKIISKLAIDENASIFASESDLAKIALVETNSIDPIDLESIDVRDYFILCCALRKENYMDQFVVNYTCDKCSEEFKEPIDFDVLIENAKEFEPKYEIVDIETKNIGTIKVELGIPNQLDLVMMEMYYTEVAKTREVSSAEKYVDYVICCIKNIQHDVEGIYADVEDFKTMHYLEKVGFIQNIQSNIETIAKLFNDVGLVTSEFFYDIECPNCKNKLKTFMDVSDFFML